MAIKIHHATVRLGAKHGITFQVVENDVVAYHAGKSLASGATAKIALDRALTKLNGVALVAAKSSPKPAKARRSADDGDENEDMEDADEGDADLGDDDEEADDDSGKSIVKKKYKSAYRPFKASCGDEMSQLISKAVKVEVKVTTKSGKTKKALRIDLARLKRLAKLNGCWGDRYADLNPGQARMCVGVRMRKLVKDGEAIKWI